MTPLVAALLLGAVATLGLAGQLRQEPRHSLRPLTTLSLMAMSDDELSEMDPVELNLIVAREIPELGNVDIRRYTKIVDKWANTIDAANRRAEPTSTSDPAYRVSREFWMAGGMAVALAGPSFGIKYTSEVLDPGNPAQQFVHGVLDKKTGTCASMPVLYLGIAHRLGWPLKAVVSGDHMWTRWDDGAKGGQRFNLEATNSASDGTSGSFNSPTDEEYAKALGTPAIAISSGSDFSSLTPRQTLGVFIQGRAAYWATRGAWDRAEQDLLLAVSCFPQNRDLRVFLADCQAHVRPRYFSAAE